MNNPQSGNHLVRRDQTGRSLLHVALLTAILAGCGNKEKELWVKGMEELKPLMASIHDRKAALTGVARPSASGDARDVQLDMLEFEQTSQPRRVALDDALLAMQTKAASLEGTQVPASEAQRSMKYIAQSIADVRGKCKSAEALALAGCAKAVDDFEQHFSDSVWVANH